VPVLPLRREFRTGRYVTCKRCSIARPHFAKPQVLDRSYLVLGNETDQARPLNDDYALPDLRRNGSRDVVAFPNREIPQSTPRISGLPDVDETAAANVDPMDYVIGDRRPVTAGTGE
jgi:hypothetical protein